MEDQLIKNDLGNAIGDSGTERYSGYFSEEPNMEWRDDMRVRNVETMRRTDATVKQLILAYKSPLLSTEWIVQPASEDPKDVEVAEFIKENLFGMDRTWKAFLREAFTFPEFGFAIFEKIFQRKNNKIYLKDLAPRIQRSILRWQTFDNKPGVTQLIRTDENVKSEASIPKNKLLILTNEMEGDDVTGISVLRSAWKHFYIKDNLYKISAISAERYGVGIPVVTLPEIQGEKEKAEAEQMAQNIRSNEEAYIVLPSKDWDVKILVPAGNPQSAQIEQLIQHHDRMILCAGLAGFLNLGANASGSYALSADQSPFFVKTIEDKAVYFCEEIGRQIIKELVWLNYGEDVELPKLTFAPLGTTNYTEFASAISDLHNAGLIDVTPELIAFIHKTFKLTEITKERIEEMKTQPAQTVIEEEI